MSDPNLSDSGTHNDNDADTPEDGQVDDERVDQPDDLFDPENDQAALTESVGRPIIHVAARQQPVLSQDNKDLEGNILDCKSGTNLSIIETSSSLLNSIILKVANLYLPKINKCMQYTAVSQKPLTDRLVAEDVIRPVDYISHNIF